MRKTRTVDTFFDLASEWLELAGDDTETVMLGAEVEALRRPAN